MRQVGRDRNHTKYTVSFYHSQSFLDQKTVWKENQCPHSTQQQSRRNDHQSCLCYEPCLDSKNPVKSVFHPKCRWIYKYSQTYLPYYDTNQFWIVGFQPVCSKDYIMGANICDIKFGVFLMIVFIIGLDVDGLDKLPIIVLPLPRYLCSHKTTSVSILLDIMNPCSIHQSH